MNRTVSGGTWAIVPVKPFSQAKTRLAPVLTDKERRQLARRLLKRSLEAIIEAGYLDRVLVVSKDEDAIGMAYVMGLYGLREKARTLNQALRFAAAHAMSQGADSILVLAADLPLLTAADVQAMRGDHADHAIIAPDRWKSGTNALFLSPPDAIQFVFGPDSFALHKEEARAAGYAIKIVDRPGLAFDLDSPTDLADLPRLSRDLGLEPVTGESVEA